VIDSSGHVVVVTGGNSGIGLGIARGVARAGAPSPSGHGAKNATPRRSPSWRGWVPRRSACGATSATRTTSPTLCGPAGPVRPPRLPGRRRRDGRQPAVHRHIAGRVASGAAGQPGRRLLVPAGGGTRSILLHAGFSPALTRQVLQQFGVTNFAAAPATYRALRASGDQPAGYGLRQASSASRAAHPRHRGMVQGRARHRSA